MSRLLTFAIYGLSGLIGIVAFTYPFLLPTRPTAAAQASQAPLLTAVLLILCLVVLLVEVQGAQVSAKIVATLGVLVAITSVLRFIEVAIPGPGGFTPIFAPIILAGYVFGARFGFLMGSLTLLASALITGGVGVWLPYQMFAAGWVGLTAGWLPHLRHPRLEFALLLAFGFGWGMAYGALMNLYSWPYLVGDAATSWQSGRGFADGLQRYAAYYLLTSLIWDLGAAFGNVLLLLILGRPTLQALTRFRHKFSFEYT
jgi:energy-coupling factor transport system substrate-specific component